MQLRVMASRHSAFYSPLLAAVVDLNTSYSVLGPGQRSQVLIREGAVDIMQSAVSSNWKPMERGESPLPVHFALINRRDGFFLGARAQMGAFQWKDLEGRSLLADHGGQPLAMLKYAAHYNGVDWGKIDVCDRGTPEEVDYVHFQAPGADVPIVASVGASMPEVAFSTLCCSREFARTDEFSAFLDAYKKSREWVRTAPANEVASKVAGLFPGVKREALADAIRRYQDLGTWNGSIGITQNLYDQALRVFGYSGFPREEVCLENSEA